MDHQIIRSRSFQAAVEPWLLECFGPAIAGDVVERNHRFLEEALELVQSKGCSRSEAHQLVDYVFDRPLGDPAQEVGGVMVTLAALCLAAGLDMHVAGDDELRRIWTKTEEIRAKQAAKPQHSPLPEAPHAAWTRLPAGYLIVRAPFLWNRAESNAWLRSIPDVEKAFGALAAATPVPYAERMPQSEASLTGAFYLGGKRLDTSDPKTLEYVRSRFEAKPKAEQAVATGTSERSVLREEVQLALQYSRNYAEASPHLTATGKEHILGLCALVEKLQAAARSPHAGAALPKDTTRLDAVLQHSWELHCFDMPTGQGDADIGWKVIEHTKLGDVEIAVVHEDDPRRAIDEALLATGPEASHD